MKQGLPDVPDVPEVPSSSTCLRHVSRPAGEGTVASNGHYLRLHFHFPIRDAGPWTLHALISIIAVIIMPGSTSPVVH